MSKVSVIIPVYKDNERLNKCINALRKQTYPKNLIELIIINNDVEKEINITENIDLEIYIYTETKPGSYAARNRGIKEAKGKILAFTDSDCIPDKNWLDQGVKALKSIYEENVLLAGKIELFYKEPSRLSIAECYEKYFGFPHQRKDKNTLTGIATANVFLCSKTFDEIGMFNSNLKSGGDSEFYDRARSNGYNVVYNPECIVFHPARYVLKDLVNKRRRLFGGKVYRKIYLEKRNKFKSVLLVLKKQLRKYSGEMFYTIKSDQIKVNYKLKLYYSIIIMLLSIIHESFLILLTGKVRR